MAYSRNLDWLVARPIAHRGLHDGNASVAENSLPAASAAIEARYAIECDVQLSADGTPHIFHDDTLERLTGDARRFRDVRDVELAALSLAGTTAGIPTVEAFLAHVGGRVPIVMELKGLSAREDRDYVARLTPAIDGYRGDLALMSFDDWLIDGALCADLSLPVGLTAEGTDEAALGHHRSIVTRGCHFVSYRVHDLENPFCLWLREERRIPLISWTVRTIAEQALSRSHADQMTFEGFAPQP